jgi:hypothetical protein
MIKSFFKIFACNFGVEVSCLHTFQSAYPVLFFRSLGMISTQYQ